MLPHWATPMQACYNPEFTPNPYYNHPPAAGSYLNHQSEADSYLNHQYAAGSYMDHQYMWQNQENNTLLQCNALHDPAKLSNKSILAEEADDIRKDRKRQSNRESAKRTRLRKKHEREDRTKIETLNEEIAVLTKQLKSYFEACLELAEENDSIEEELIKEYGPELIADLLFMKPTA
ncbi:putative transcription factor bZIP family [Medicago truncatula]|uniref:Putative transcription factor bZIP family n=1 Tax=Medicago truncatula TaxID=3880 RepID=A0A396IES0_MEDTR|nr:G-box-binding factor 1-like isoform X3 [Medicago truncatula]RHN64080.1 putative transcription factor bZIP family [Medicago truncatula]